LGKVLLNFGRLFVVDIVVVLIRIVSAEKVAEHIRRVSAKKRLNIYLVGFFYDLRGTKNQLQKRNGKKEVHYQIVV